MNEIEKRFRRVSKTNPSISSLFCFFEAIVGQGFPEADIDLMFNNLVDPNDYEGHDKNKLLMFLPLIVDFPETLMELWEKHSRKKYGIKTDIPRKKAKVSVDSKKLKKFNQYYNENPATTF
jgi:hypothetical protein